MKRIVCIIIVLFAAAAVLCARSYAFFEDVKALDEALPADAADTLASQGITPSDGLAWLSLPDVLSAIAGALRDAAGLPAAMSGAVIAALMITSLIKNTSGSSGSAARLIPMTSSLCVSAIICGYMSAVIAAAQSAFSSVSDFMLVYIPVFGGVVAADGHAASAAVYTALCTGTIQLLARVSEAVIIPLVSCMLGISAAGSAQSAADAGSISDRLCDGVKKAAVWGLGLIMTIFTGLLCVQTAVSSAADSTGLRAVKFTAASAVPFVGGAVSEAVSAVAGSLSLLKTGAGGYGIAAGAVLLIPAAAKIIVLRISLFFLGLFAELSGCPQAGSVIKAAQSAAAVIFALICCFTVFAVISSAMILVMCRG